MKCKRETKRDEYLIEVVEFERSGSVLGGVHHHRVVGQTDADSTQTGVE